MTANPDAPIPVAAPIVTMTVRIVDVSLPFWSMVGLLLQVALASIPALLILAALGAIVLVALSGPLGL